MKKFKQMSKSDRIKMEALLNAGLSKAAVAEQLHFHKNKNKSKKLLTIQI